MNDHLYVSLITCFITECLQDKRFPRILCFDGNLTGCREGLVGSLWGSTSSVPGKEEPLATIQAGDVLAGEQLCWNGSLGSSKLNTSHSVLWQPSRPAVPWSVSIGVYLSDWGKSLTPPTQHSLDFISNTAPSFGPTNAKKDIAKLEHILQRDTRILGVKGLELLPWEERLRERSLFSL